MLKQLVRPLALLLAAAIAAASALPALAQPAKTLRLVVPFPAGGTADILPRLLAEKMGAAYPAGIVVENKSGAGGNIGGDFVARADADGSTFLVSPPGPIASEQPMTLRPSQGPAVSRPTLLTPITVTS